MPNVSAFLSGGVSVGILAGVVSGLFCLVVAGIRWAGKLKAEQEARHSRLQQECCQCSKPLPLLPAKRVSCDHCGRRACGTCSAAAPRDGRWLCSACSHEREVKLQSGEWFFRQVQRRFNTAALANSKHKSEDGEGMDPECVQVREFIERLVESLVAGGLDDVCVKRLHSHPEYDRMFACHHASLCEALARLAFTLQMAIANKPMPEQESPSAAHSALKQLIHQIIQEAMTLPTLQGFENRSLNRRASQEHGMSAEDMTSKTYEDILATAILNKVIERYQQTGGLGGTTLDGNSNLLNSSNMEQQPKFISRLEIGVKSPDSLEEANASNISFVDDCNMSEASITDPLSFTIEECIEEVTTYSQSDDEEEDDIDDDDEEEEVVLIEPALDSGLNFYRSSLDFIKGHRVPFPELGMDIIDGQPLTPSDEEKAEEPYLDDLSSPQPTDMISPVDSWEENWLFQRRRLKSSGVPPPMPVPMLVPNPSEEYRALIGDRDVEEYSDLSDCSDSVLEDLVLASVGDNSNHQDLPVPVRDEVNSLGDLQDTYRPVRAIPCITVDMLDEETEKQHDQDECNQEMQDFVDSGEINCKVQGSEHGDPMEEYSSMNEGLELAEAKNVELYNSSSVDCLSEFGQQDSEYTEDYATVTQRQMDSLSGASEPELPTSPVTRTSSPTVSSDYTMHPTSIEQSTNQSLTDEPQLDSNESQAVSELAMPPRPGIDQSDDENCTLPRTGTIAEREHKKWESATPLPNNPYSSENISKRLSRRTPYNRHSSSSDTSVEFPELKSETIVGGVIEKPLQIVCASDDLDYKRYGRDYYINSKAPSGERKTSLSSVVTTSSSSSNINSQQPQVSGAVLLSVGKLEEQILNRDIYHATFRARNASPQFKMNPLYEAKDGDETVEMNCTHDKEGREDLTDEDELNVELDAHHPFCSSSASLQFKMNPLYKPYESNKGNNANETQSYLKVVSNNNKTLCTYTEELNGHILSGRGTENWTNKSNLHYLDYEGKHQMFYLRNRGNSESGYSSSLDSLSDHQSTLLRLTPPATPQMIERSFESLSSLRRSESLKTHKSRKKASSPMFGGSLRISKRERDELSKLW